MAHRRLPLLVVVVAVLLAGTSSSVLADDLVRRNKMLHILNQTRRNHGRPVLRLNVPVSHRAWVHSRKMVLRNTLFHTRQLYDAVRRYRPTAWGENVGYAGDLARVRTLWVRSSGHRAILLNPRYRRVGVGVMKARGVLWVTAIFYGR
jgi:uncharacterized protein YkwD